MEIYPTKIPRNESTSQGMTRLTDLKHLVKSLDPKIKINTTTNTQPQSQSQSQIFSTSYSNPIDFLKIPPKTINQTSGSSRTLHLSSGYSLDEQEEMILDLRFEETKKKFLIPNKLKKRRKARKKHKRNQVKFLTQDHLFEEY
ncbi:hypothetical protein M0813_28914 [Anaeramoeba flamelloides]|uniref:Mitochondrial mRNA-processing protein COX24 C-terminal domain-containing protein n=1 Tax=Anaeramoeba flamelloides TaxID=1746091 RepID=A0ABQ8XQP7_9EUKA|nr:hypothetical protein M0813_28914 [Anaeramoeba flamelloides]